MLSSGGDLVATQPPSGLLTCPPACKPVVLRLGLNLREKVAKPDVVLKRAHSLAVGLALGVGVMGLVGKGISVCR